MTWRVLTARRQRRRERAQRLPRAVALAGGRRPALWAGGLGALVISGWSLLTPASAHALSLPPISPVPGFPTAPLTGIGTQIFTKAFLAILNSLFAGIPGKLTAVVLGWLTSIDGQTGGHVASLYSFTSGMALGLLGAVVTVSMVRYWIAGLSQSGSGGFEAVEGLLRSLGAVAFLVLWPFVFGQLVALSDICLGDDSG